MGKKNEKKICWNCDGYINQHLTKCPYCSADVTKSDGDSFFSSSASESIPKPPYASLSSFSATDSEWNEALEKKEEDLSEKEPHATAKAGKNEMIALLLLLPGIVFLLFGLALLLFSTEGVLTLQWNQSFAYFYFLGAIPLLFFGWKALNR